MLKVGHAALQRTQALARLGQAHLGIGELTGGLGIVTANAIELIVGLGNLETQVACLCTRLVTRTGELVNARARGTNGLGSLLAALGDAHALDLGIVGALLQAADLGEQRAALALKTGDLTGGIALGGTGLLDGNVGLDDLVRSMLKDGSQIGFQALELTDAALALQGTQSLAGIKPHAHQAAAGDAGAIGGHVSHAFNDRRRQRGSKIVNDVIAAEQRLDDGTVACAHGQTINQTGTGGALRGGRAAHATRHQQCFARGLLLVQSSTTGTLKRGRIVEQQRIDIAGKQLLHQALKLARGLEHVAQTTRDIVAQRTHQTAHERRAVGHAGIEFLLAGKLRAHLGQPVARLALAGTQVLQGRACRLGGLTRIDLSLARFLKSALKLVGAVATALERGRDLLELLVDLLQARGVHVVLDLGVAQRVLHLGELERGVIGHTLHIALLARELRNLIVERHTTLVELGGGRTGGVNVVLGLHVRTGHFLKLGTRILELLDHATTLMLGARNLPAHVRQARHHVVALFLEQAHVGVDAADHILHMTALLA